MMLELLQEVLCFIEDQHESLRNEKPLIDEERFSKIHTKILKIILSDLYTNAVEYYLKLKLDCDGVPNSNVQVIQCISENNCHNAGNDTNMLQSPVYYSYNQTGNITSPGTSTNLQTVMPAVSPLIETERPKNINAIMGNIGQNNSQTHCDQYEQDQPMQVDSACISTQQQLCLTNKNENVLRPCLSTIAVQTDVFLENNVSVQDCNNVDLPVTINVQPQEKMSENEIVNSATQELDQHLPESNSPIEDNDGDDNYSDENSDHEELTTEDTTVTATKIFQSDQDETNFFIPIPDLPNDIVDHIKENSLQNSKITPSFQRNIMNILVKHILSFTIYPTHLQYVILCKGFLQKYPKLLTCSTYGNYKILKVKIRDKLKYVRGKMRVDKNGAVVKMRKKFGRQNLRKKKTDKVSEASENADGDNNLCESPIESCENTTLTDIEPVPDNRIDKSNNLNTPTLTVPNDSIPISKLTDIEPVLENQIDKSDSLNTPTLGVPNASIPVPKLPSYIQQNLEKGELSEHVKRIVVKSLLQQILQFTMYPTRVQYRDFFIKFVGKYPMLTDETPSGYEYWKTKIRDRLKMKRRSLLVGKPHTPNMQPAKLAICNGGDSQQVANCGSMENNQGNEEIQTQISILNITPQDSNFLHQAEKQSPDILLEAIESAIESDKTLSTSTIPTLPELPPHIKQHMNNCEANKIEVENKFKREISSILHEHMLQFTLYPTRKQYKHYCKGFVDKYPILNDNSLSGFEFWKEKIRSRFKEKRRLIKAINSTKTELIKKL